MRGPLLTSLIALGLTRAQGSSRELHATFQTSAVLRDRRPENDVATILPDFGDPISNKGDTGMRPGRQQHHYGSYGYFCGNFATGENGDLLSGVSHLMEENMTFYVLGRGCYRPYCYETSAIYVCNDNTWRYEVPGYYIGFMARAILRLCCVDAAQAGQMFHPTEGWNVIVGYGNCNHKKTHRPAWYGNGGGPNGNCVGSTIPQDMQ